ncbi:MAG: hypothetical protein ACREYC_28585 [Gammaproteobacteria bacterium]
MAFRIHDDDRCLVDNAGFVSVAVQSAPFTFAVESTREWQPTSLRVTAGQPLTFSAVGSWNVGLPDLPFVGPDGYSPEMDRTIFQGCKLDPLLPYGRLLVRVGDSPSFGAIGSQGAFASDRDGLLAFRIHDADRCLVDNAGFVSVTAVTGNQPPPQVAPVSPTPSAPVPIPCQAKSCRVTVLCISPDLEVESINY